MRLLYVVGLGFLCFGSALQGVEAVERGATTKIVVAEHIAALCEHVERESDLVLFDLDATLVTRVAGEYCLIEPEVREIIANLQKRGHKVLALTARKREPFFGALLGALRELGVDFARSGFEGAHFAIPGTQGPAWYRQGVISAGVNDKGAILQYVLERCGVRPTKIIFIDDKWYNLEAVAQCVTVPFVGLHYQPNKPHKKVRRFVPAEVLLAKWSLR